MLLINKFKEYLPYYKRNLKVAIPVMLTQIGGALVGLFDTMMVGHYTTVDLAAVSFSNALFFTIMVFASGSLMGLTPLIGVQDGEISKYPEKGDAIHRKIASLLQNGLYFTLIISAVSILLMTICIPFLDSFGQDPEVVEVARPYYILMIISLLPYLLFCLQKQFLEGLGNTVAAMVVVLTMNLLNILLNWVLIYGHWGAPAMGAFGAGIATLVSRAGMQVCLFAVIALRSEWRGYVGAFSHRLSSWREVCRIARIGFPVGGQTFFENATFALSVIVLGWIGKEAMAAHQIAVQVSNVTFMLALGIGAGTTIRVSHQFGKGDLHAVRMAGNASIHLVLAICTLTAVLMFGFHNLIPRLFTDDPTVIAIASQLVMIAGLFQYADGLQNVGAAMLRGITDVKVPMLIAFVSYIIVELSAGILCTFVLGMGPCGMWVGFIAGLTLASVLLHTRFNKKYREMCRNAADTGK